MLNGFEDVPRTEQKRDISNDSENGTLERLDTKLETDPKNLANVTLNNESETATEMDSEICDENGIKSGVGCGLNGESQCDLKDCSVVELNGSLNSITVTGVKNSVENGTENDAKNILEDDLVSEAKNVTRAQVENGFKSDSSISVKTNSRNSLRVNFARDIDMSNGQVTRSSDDIGTTVVVGTRLPSSRKSEERQLQSPDKEQNEKDMKKEKRKTSSKFSMKGRTHVGEDLSKLIGEFAPGKNGGRYEFPFGGHMTVDSGVVNNKRDVISCCMVSPSDRYKYVFDLKPYEVFLSEFFLLRWTFTTRPLKKPIHLRLSVGDEPRLNCEFCVRQRGVDEEEWAETEFSTAVSANGQHYVDVIAPRSVVFVVTSRPKTEVFEVPVQGCLHNSHLSKQISLRFPKKATDICVSCEIQIMSMNRANFANLAKDYPHDMADLLAATDYFNISTSVEQPFRRAVTVKLPLPALDDENFPQDDIVVMVFVGDSWQLMETPIKFTKSAITFETRTLGRYCVVLCRPQRRRRMKETFRHIHEDERVVRGEVLVFVHVAEKLWNLWMEVVPTERAPRVVESRELQGFRHIAKAFSPPPVVEATTSFSSRRSSWRQPQREAPKKVERTDIDLVSGRIIELQLTGDVQIGGDDPGRFNTGLRFEERLAQNYRYFVIEPVSIEKCCPLTAQLRCYVSGADGAKCVRTFDLDFELEAVKAYLDKGLEEPEMESVKSAVLEPIKSVVSVTNPHFQIPNDAASGDATHIPEKAAKKITEQRSPKRNTMSANESMKKNEIRTRASIFARLTKPIKPPREAIRESKVLTGRSLACLAREVEQGLTLAIYLGISDSTITGMGFDALANGQSIVDITYRILLLWKRRSNHYKNKQVDLLADALNDMGRSDLVAVVMDHHRQNIELTPDCFVTSGL